MLRVNRAFPMAALGPIAVALLLLFSAFSSNVQGEDHETLRVGGTGSALGGMKLLAHAFMKAHPDSQVVVLPSLGSGGGIKALEAKKIDVAVSARPLKEAEQSKGLVEREYVRTPVVFATRDDTWFDGVTLDEVTRMYAGKQDVWSDGTRLRLVMRPATEADTNLLRSMSPEMDKAVKAATERQDLFVAINDQDNAKALEDIRGSLGVISLGQLMTERRRLKPLALDNLKGTVESVRDGTYPYVKHLYIILGPVSDKLATEFVGFVWSAEGRQILSSHGNLVTEPPGAPNM